MEAINKYFDTPIDTVLKNYITVNNVISAFIQLVTLLYVSQLSPKLPKSVSDFFKNKYVTLLVFALIMWTAKVRPSLSIVLAIGFMVATNAANNQPLWEFLENTELQEASPPKEASPSVEVVPSAALATDSVAVSLDQSIENPKQVEQILQESTTMTIQPTILETDKGPVVSNPSIVIAPLVVEKPNGETVLVKPDVTFVNTPAMTAGVELAAKLPEQEAKLPKQPQLPVEAKQPEKECGNMDMYFKKPYDMSKVKTLDSLDSYAEFKN